MFQYKTQSATSYVSIFENHYQIRLPESYRNFCLQNKKLSMKQVYYPLYRLQQTVKSAHLDFMDDDDLIRAYLHEPCRIYPNMGETVWEQWNTYQMVNEYDDNEFFELQKQRFGGLLPIGTEGCTIEIMLILNGKYHGQVVFFDCAYPQYYPIFMGDFSKWYQENA